MVIQHSFGILFCLSNTFKNGINSFLIQQKIVFLVIFFFRKTLNERLVKLATSSQFTSSWLLVLRKVNY